MPSPVVSSVRAQAGMPEAIFFDVDGVLIESLTVKGEAFALVFKDFPDDRASIIDYHLAHGGVNRVEKIRQIFVELTGRQPTDGELVERVEDLRVWVCAREGRGGWVGGERAAEAARRALGPVHRSRARVRAPRARA